MIRIVIIEDEYLASTRLKSMILDNIEGSQIIASLESVADSIKFFKTADNYDLIMMDIHLSDGNSFDIFDAVNIDKPIIMTTAYESYALPAFKHFVIDYLLKPIKLAELKSAFEKYYKIRPNPTGIEQSNSKNLVIRIGNNIKYISCSDIIYYFTSDKINYCMTQDGHKYPLDISLDNVEKELDTTKFFRLNRQYITDRKAIQQVSTHSKGRVKIYLPFQNEAVIVSSEKSPEFKKWMAG